MAWFLVTRSTVSIGDQSNEHVALKVIPIEKGPSTLSFGEANVLIEIKSRTFTVFVDASSDPSNEVFLFNEYFEDDLTMGDLHEYGKHGGIMMSSMTFTKVANEGKDNTVIGFIVDGKLSVFVEWHDIPPEVWNLEEYLN